MKEKELETRFTDNSGEYNRLKELVTCPQSKGLSMQELETIVDHECQLFDHMCEIQNEEKTSKVAVTSKNKPNWAEKLKKENVA